MAPRRSVIPIIFLVLALSTSGCLDQLFQASDKQRAIVLPVSHIGDEFQYMVRVQGRNGSFGDWREDTHYWIKDEGPMLDFQGHVRPAVHVVQTTMEPYWTQDRQTHYMNETREAWFDEASSPLRLDLINEVKMGSLTMRDRWSFLDGDGAGVEPPGLEFQGRRLTAGLEIVAAASPTNRSPLITTGGGGGGGAFKLGNRYLVNEDYVGVGWKERGDSSSGSPPAIERFVGEPATKGGSIAFPVVSKVYNTAHELTSATREWFVATQPYPILTETEWGVDHWSKTFRSERSLASLHRGAEPVTWSCCSEGQHSSLGERTPGDQRYPADGKALPYPLAIAVADARTTPLVAAWQLTHPGSVLVSAWMQHGRWNGSTTEGWAWQLAFATPAGEGRVFSTERTDLASAPIVQDHGDIAFPAFRLEDLPASPLTIHAAGDAWRLWSNRVGAPITFVRWGFHLDWKMGPPCLGGTYSPGRTYTREELATLWVGDYTGGSCVETGSRVAGNAIGAHTGLGVYFGGVGWDVDWEGAGR